MSSKGPFRKKVSKGEGLEKKRSNKKKDIDLTIGKWENEKHTVEASAKEGFMCRVTVNSKLPMTPSQLFGVFSNPDNSHIFRDLGKTVKYEVVEDDGAGHQCIELEQRAVLKFLAIPYKFSTFLRVELDFNRMTMKFKLAKRGMMKKFDGGWTLEPIMDGKKIVGCHAQLVQDVLPIFVPPFLTNLLTGVSVHVVIRLLEDLEALCKKYSEGMNMSQLLGSTKWIDQNETLKAWRQEQEIEWSKERDEKFVCEVVSINPEDTMESSPSSTHWSESFQSNQDTESAPNETVDSGLDNDPEGPVVDGDTHKGEGQ